MAPLGAHRAASPYAQRARVRADADVGRCALQDEVERVRLLEHRVQLQHMPVLQAPALQTPPPPLVVLLPPPALPLPPPQAGQVRAEVQHAAAALAQPL